jgi:hypothetical protein
MKLFFRTALWVGATMAIATLPAMAFDHSHGAWSAVLKQSVSWSESTSAVNYRKLKSDSLGLEQYLATLSDVTTTEFNKWTRDQQLSFLINAYNAWTIKLILDHYPVKSIKDIGGIFSNPWKMKFFKLFGNKTSLDWIEHEKIRPGYDEPRIHFALVCASKGCPGLRAEAFTADTLEAQLQDSAAKFINDKTRNHYDAAKQELYLSPIFKWYKEDFIKAKGSVQSFVFTFLTVSSKSISPTVSPTISYLDYDWTLNEI